MKKRQLITLENDEQQLLHDLSMLEYGTAEHNLSKTVAEALRRMAEDYIEDLKKLETMREEKRLRKVKQDASRD